MSPVDPAVGEGTLTPVEVHAAAQDAVREAVAAEASSASAGSRWLMPLAAVAAVTAAACVPIAWPLLVGGAGAASAALSVTFGQVGGVSGNLLAEMAVRVWDKLRARGGPAIGQSELREALAAELGEALMSSSSAAKLRAEVAGILHGVDAVKVALTTTIETTVQDSSEQVRAVLIRGLRELGTQFTEFGWLLDEVNDQITRIAQTQIELAAGSRAMLEAQQRTLMQLTILRQQTSPARFGGRGGPNDLPNVSDASPDKKRAAALDAAGIPVSPDCPYPGLAAFGPQDADRFFGRQQETAALITRLAEQLTRPGLLIVFGPSGAGKSSLLRAGLVPAIAAGGFPAQGSQAWPLDLFTPGRKPLLELATRIAALAGVPAGALLKDLRTDPIRIIAAIRQALLVHARRQAEAVSHSTGHAPLLDLDATSQSADAADVEEWAADVSSGRADCSPRLVLIVDQFEEVFTQCTDVQERRAFIDALCAAAGTTATAASLPSEGMFPELISPLDAPAMVVIGIRADFYARCATFPMLAKCLADCQVLVGPLTVGGLRAAIEGPAAAAGLVVDAGLVEVLLTDLGLRFPPAIGLAISKVADEKAADGQASPEGGSYEPGRLPLLAYALQQTWRHRKGRRLTVATYRATGGIDKAVARAAEAVYERFDTNSRQVVRRLLLRLISLGEGTADTRRQVTVTELAGALDIDGLADTQQAVITRKVLTKLVQARLVTADTGTDGGDVVEISHEALLWAWPRLRGWLSQDRAGQRIHRDLTEAARAWQAQDREPSHLLRGNRLAVANEWAASHGPDLNSAEHAFLAACQRHKQRATWLRRTAASALVLLTLVSAGAASFAINSNTQAVRQRDQAIKNQVEAEAEQLQTADPSLAAQLDLVADHLDPTLDSASQLLGIANTPLSNPLTGPGGAITSVAFSPDGHTLAVDGDSIQLWNVTGPTQATRIGQPLSTPGRALSSVVAFSPNGHILAVGRFDGTIWLWNTASPAQATRIGQPLSTHGPALTSVVFSPDGHTLAASGLYGTTQLWNITSPAHATPIGRPLAGLLGDISSMAFSPDGHTLALGNSNGTTQLWNITSPAHATRIGPPLEGPVGQVTSVAFSPDGHILAAGGDDGTSWLWNVTAPAHATLISHFQPGSGITCVAFSPDGHTLAGGRADGTIWLWNVTTPGHATQVVQPLSAPGGGVTSVAFSPDGHTLAAGRDDGTIRLWSLPSTVLTGPVGSVFSVSFSPDGQTLAAGSGDGAIRLWNVPAPAHAIQIGQPLKGPAGQINSVAFSPDGHTLAVGSDVGTMQIWDVTDPIHATQVAQPLYVPSGSVYSVAFSPDGHTLAVGGDDGGDTGTIWLWNLATPTQGAPTGKPMAASGLSDVTSLAFSPDGHTLAASDSRGAIRLWNTTTPGHATPFGQALSGPLRGVASVAFSPDGHTLAAGGDDGTIRLWNVTSPAHASQIGQPLTAPGGFVYSVAFSPDGHTLAAGSGDGTIQLWNVTSPAHASQIGQPLAGPTGGIYSVAFSPDGHTLAAGGSDGTIRLWDLDLDFATHRICAATRDNLTPDQWAHYIPQLPYDPPCSHL